MRKEKQSANDGWRTPLKRVGHALSLPLDVIEGLPEIELIGNKEAVIGHCQGVLEYNESLIRVNTGHLIVRFTGRNLQLSYITSESVMITGYFTCIDFT